MSTPAAAAAAASSSSSSSSSDDQQSKFVRSRRLKPKPGMRRVARTKGNRLIPVTFSRGLNATFNSQVIQKSMMPCMTRVTSSGNKKCDLVLRDLMWELLTQSKRVMRHCKRDRLSIDILHDALRHLLPNDTLDLVQKAHTFAMQRIKQCRESFQLIPEEDAGDDGDEEGEDEEEGEEDEGEDGQEAPRASAPAEDEEMPPQEEEEEKEEPSQPAPSSKKKNSKKKKADE